MKHNEQGSAAGVSLAVIALAVAVVALILSWIAYNRTGENLEDKIQNQINDSAQQVEDATDEGAQQIDEGPDGVDEDDTDTTQPTGNNEVN